MAARLIKLPPFQGTLLNAAAATLRIPALDQNYIYKEIILVTSGNLTKAHFANVLLDLGGKQIIPNMTGSQLDSIAKFQGDAGAATILPLMFYQPSARSEHEARIGEIDTTALPGSGANRYSNFSLEITTDAAADFSASTLTGYAMVDDEPKPVFPLPNGKQLDTSNMIRAFVKTVQVLGNNGDNPFNLGMGADPNNHMRQLHAFHSNITSFEVRKAQRSYFDRVPVAVIQYAANQTRRATQSGLLTLDFVKDGDELNGLSRIDESNGGVAQMTINSIQSASDTPIFYADMYGNWAGF